MQSYTLIYLRLNKGNVSQLQIPIRAWDLAFCLNVTPLRLPFTRAFLTFCLNGTRLILPFTRGFYHHVCCTASAKCNSSRCKDWRQFCRRELDFVTANFPPLFTAAKIKLLPQSPRVSLLYLLSVLCIQCFIVLLLPLPFNDDYYW